MIRKQFYEQFHLNSIHIIILVDIRIKCTGQRSKQEQATKQEKSSALPTGKKGSLSKMITLSGVCY